jgi:two-component system LytT family response regulator
MIKTIIVDDEYNAREFLEKLLTKSFPGKFLILEKTQSVDEAITAIEKYQPDLVFLDIQMPNKNGFELFKSIKIINFEVIFTTAHAEFAIDAIKASALDYLLKPINYIDLLEAIKRFDAKTHKAFQQERLRLLLDNIDNGVSEFKKIAFPTDSGFELIKTSSILYCEADSNYCHIKCVDGKKITLSKTLKYVEELLPENIFNRIHKSYLVNLNYVNRFHKNDDYIVELSNGEKLPVSVRKKENFLNAIIKKK